MRKSKSKFNPKIFFIMELNWKTKLFLLSISQFFYRAGSRSIIPILPFLIKDVSTLNNEQTILWSGWILSSPFLISFFTTPFWGTVGDKIGRNFTTFFAVLGFVLSQFGIYTSNTLLLILISFSIQEIFGGAYPSAISFASVFSPKEKVADSLSYLQFSNALGNILGPLFGGLITDYFGVKYVFIFFGTVVLLFSLPILFFKEKKSERTHSKKISLWNNILYFVKNKSLILLAILLLFYTLSVTMIRPSFTIFIQKQFNSNNNLATLSGLLFTLFGLSSALSNLLLPKLKNYLDINLLLKISFFVSGIFFLLSIFIVNLFLFTIILLVIGFCLGIVLPIIYTLMGDKIESISKAGVMGIGSSFQMIGNLVGPSITGFFVINSNINFSFINSGIILILGFMLIIFSGRKIEKNS